MTEQLTALVMAGSRRGPQDVVAQHAGVSHKCLAPLADKPMLLWVAEALVSHPAISRILVSIENESILRQNAQLSALLDDSVIEWVPAQGNLFESFQSGLAAAQATPPILVTTGDNPLLTLETLQHFLDQGTASAKSAIAGFATRRTVEAAYPGVKRTYLQFRDGEFSACNLFLLKGPEALEAARIFAGGGQFGKRAFRTFRALGPGTVLHYWRRDLTLTGFLDRLSRRLGVTLGSAILPVAEAAMDVDKPSDFDLAQRILLDQPAR